MGNPPTTAELTRRLAESHRVVVLGGLAVISHGHPRPTYDADAWLDPTLDPLRWARAVLETTGLFSSLHIVSIGDWKKVDPASLPDVIEGDGVVRVMGANQPLDIFRNPNELEMGMFDEVWARALPLEDGTRLPDTVDLLMSKQATGREKDLQDIAFLEAKAEREYLARLPAVPAAEATAMLERFLTPRVAEAAAAHPDTEVRALGMRFLRELTADGDPFARDILKRLDPEA